MFGLGFAVAAMLIKPDVLILDEVLAVGDARFRSRCLSQMREITKEAAVIFVSHNEFSVRHVCNRGILLDKGRVRLSGPVDEVFAEYMSTEDIRVAKFENLHESIQEIEVKLGCKNIEFLDSLTVCVHVTAKQSHSIGYAWIAFVTSTGVIRCPGNP